MSTFIKRSTLTPDSYESYHHDEWDVGWGPNPAATAFSRVFTYSEGGSYTHEGRRRPRFVHKYPTSLPQAKTEISRNLVAQSIDDYFRVPNRKKTAFIDFPRVRRFQIDLRSHLKINLKVDALDTDWSLELRNKIADHSASLSGMVAEFDEVVGMANSLSKGIRNAGLYAHRKIKRLPRARRRLNLHDVSGAHLVYSFGLSPLINDTYQTIDHFRKSGRGENIWHRFRVKTERSNYDRQTVDADYGSTGDYGVVTSQGSLSVEDTAVAWARFQDRLLPDLGNPLEWAWERIPFSFIVDQIINVGENIAAIDALNRVEEIHTSVTRRQRWDIKYFSTNTSMHGFSRGHTYERKAMGAPPLSFDLSYKPSSNFGQLLTNLSLLHQLRKRSPNRGATGGKLIKL